MPVSVNGGPPLACRWRIDGNDTTPDDTTWIVEVQGTADQLVPLAVLEQVRVRFDTPFGRARGQAKLTRVVVDVTRLPPASAVLTGIGALAIKPDAEPAAR